MESSITREWDDSSYASDDNEDSHLGGGMERGEYTLVQDACHGLIRVRRRLVMDVLNTAQFQRLRRLKQCGPCHYVFPSATHTRFEHSIGVYHVAGQMLDVLIEKGAEDYVITREERLCVELAALCHDLGHGPYSHLWEGYLHRMDPTSDWKHEEMSKKMLRYLIENNTGLRERFEDEGLFEEHISLIEDIIEGAPRSPNHPKPFLFQIVANKRTGIDVDRLEYMMRDARQFGVPCQVDIPRIIFDSRIVSNNIAFRDKVVPSIREVFECRARLHRICYQHRVAKLIEVMIIDALIEARHFKIKFGNGEVCELSKAHLKVETMMKLTDEVFYLIEEEDGSPASKILKRIANRRLYATLATIRTKPGELLHDRNVLEEKLKEVVHQLGKECEGKHSFTWGVVCVSGGLDPSCNLPPFYDKHLALVQVPRERFERVLLESYNEAYVYWRDEEPLEEELLNQLKLRTRQLFSMGSPS